MRAIDYSIEPSVVEGRPTLSSIDDVVSTPLETKPSKGWYIALSITLSMLIFGAVCLALTLIYGVGLWGVNQPIGWGFDIVNFVFWVGIGHAGTLISAILFLLRQRWRTGIARFAEAMTIFAVMCAGLFPLIHT
ncbi:MAG: hydrogenase, partial [Ignavibacteria bacterium]|nr:hydrogenase [Ignavibacteria bacterium]